jgi:hypothetical protein
MIIETVLAGVFCVAVFYAHLFIKEQFPEEKMKIQHCSKYTS